MQAYINISETIRIAPTICSSQSAMMTKLLSLKDILYSLDLLFSGS